uniref:Uncharacterized protein n=1 Tax=Brassica oleracea TaxID=3712 RepID=A0A3P6DN03_BRAOL|nr:unnamed protein product [Brassica oleracea]
MRNQEHIEKKSISYSLYSNALNKNEMKLESNYLSFSSKPKTLIQEPPLNRTASLVTDLLLPLLPRNSPASWPFIILSR